MIIRIIAASIMSLFFIWLLSWIIKDDLKFDRQIESEIKYILSMINDMKKETDPVHKPFSVSEYLDRMEKLHIDLHRKREAEKREPVVLWWGEDGMRINEDGTTEWISRRPKRKEVVYSPDTETIMDIMGNVYAYNVQTTTLDDTRWLESLQTPQEKIQELKMEMGKLEVNAAITQKISEIINGLNVQRYLYDDILSSARDIHGNIIRQRRYPN